MGQAAVQLADEFAGKTDAIDAEVADRVMRCGRALGESLGTQP
jgi:hypothetical protein